MAMTDTMTIGSTSGSIISNDDTANAPLLSMFQISDPIMNTTIDLDDIFNDMFYVDLLLQDDPKSAPPDAVTSTDGGGLDPLDALDAMEAQKVVAVTTAAVVAAPQTAAPEPVPSSKRSADHLVSTRRKDAGGDENGDDGGVLTEEQIIERRERNREHAKRSRLRKKFLLESLQEQIHGLEEQLDRFRATIRTELPDTAEDIITRVCGDKDKYKPLSVPSGFGPVKTLMEPDFRLVSALTGSQQNFAISDPTMPDNPIVFCSQGFLDLTGYTLDQVLGRNCRFLQGPGTDQAAVNVIRQGIANGVDTSVCLLNYRADGSAFWNQFFVAALRDAENNVVNYVGIQCEVSKAVVDKHLKDPKAK